MNYLLNESNDKEFKHLYQESIVEGKPHFEKIKEFYDKEREEAEKQNNMLSNNNKNEINRPNIAPPSNQPKPTYVAKRSA